MEHQSWSSEYVGCEEGQHVNREVTQRQAPAERGREGERERGREGGREGERERA